MVKNRALFAFLGAWGRGEALLYTLSLDKVWDTRLKQPPFREYVNSGRTYSTRARAAF